MIKYFICSLLSLTALSGVRAQEGPIHTGFGFGYQLVNYQQDFGFGLQFTSPCFANQSLAIRLKGNLMYNQNVVNGQSTWMPYSNVSLGMIGMAGKIGDFIRLYGEGGVVVLLPNSRFSSDDTEIGGYGLFGFEFFFYKAGNYFIEIGGIGTGASADKIAGSPIYSNGMTLSTGFRFFLR